MLTATDKNTFDRNLSCTINLKIHLDQETLHLDFFQNTKIYTNLGCILVGHIMCKFIKKECTEISMLYLLPSRLLARN